MSDWQTVINWDAGYVAGIKVERERIIKLLENHTKIWHKSEKLSCEGCDFEGYDDEFDKHLLALIKGEK
jgi:uncharacterized protein (DUF1786 family)